MFVGRKAMEIVMKIKSPLRLAVAIFILLMIIYLGFAGAVSIISGKPISFGIFSRNAFKKGDNTENFVVAGVDEEGYRTDLILFCHFDPSDNSLTALQIPRDTKVDTKRNDKKINSAYGSPGKTETMFDEIEDVIGIRPEDYVIVGFKGFRELIDAIGGVEVDVPFRMYYTDPAQNLVIDLRQGKQLLDGKHAEMFMRFRYNNDGTGYKNGDIDRIAAQRQFYNSALNKLLSGGTILKAPKILGIINSNVSTSFTAEEIVKYIGRIPKLSTDKINIITLPGEGRYEGNISYFFHDKEKTKELIETYFSRKSTSGEGVEINPVKNKFIKVKVIDATSLGSEELDVCEVISQTLTQHGFKVITAEKSERIRDKSQIISHNAKHAAEDVAKTYPNIEVYDEIEIYEKQDGEKSAPDVTIIAGNDFSF